MKILECTDDHPYTKERDQADPGAYWTHKEAREVGDQVDGWPSGDTVRMQCATCGKTWTEELPQ